ncbi:MAG: cytochrome c3 family protein [candidate division Zixibacteria bacterium]|nr:cytochrome c3 family protein [candidate division Zixibacteria bacterium]
MKRYLPLFLLVGLLLWQPSFAQDDNGTCIACHAEAGMTGLDRHGLEISMTVVQESIDSSVHAGMNCVDCHADLAGTTDYPHKETANRVDCGTCHADIQPIYAESAHGTAGQDNPNAPTCASCHAKHNILRDGDVNATTSAKNLPNTCSACHSKLALKLDPDIRIADSHDRYMRGIHAQGIAKGIGSAASCNDCHGMHDLKKASDPRSLVNKMNIPSTCSKCHNDIYIQYSRGIHGKALAAGILDSPNCTDCHGEHEILEIDDPNSPVNSANIADFVCAKCHNDPRINEKFGLADAKFTSYQDSYHGLAVKGGSIKAATCASCHRAHDILPKSNIASSIHPDNLTGTCQKCHPKANASFAASYSHNTAETEFHDLNSLVANIYLIAIILIIGGMLAHNLIIVGRFVVDKHRSNKGQPVVERFTKGMVWQHLILTFAFITLVITGFALRYPHEWWVRGMSAVGLSEDVRSVVHRIAAVLLCYISFHHAIFLLFTRRGKVELRGLWPNLQDVKDIKTNLMFYLGLSKERPRFDQYDYTEKAEYWALVWGTFIMALTGFILWFPTFFTSFMPAWTVKIAETVHLYEAWLATLAIAVFHFFFVIFHPDQYPMSMTWLTGKMTVESCEHHHPAWFDRIKSEQKIEESKEKADVKH